MGGVVDSVGDALGGAADFVGDVVGGVGDFVGDVASNIDIEDAIKAYVMSGGNPYAAAFAATDFDEELGFNPACHSMTLLQEDLVLHQGTYQEAAGIKVDL
jgi:hypothetical protein